MNKLKPKKCRWCKAEFMPFNSMQKACSIPCAQAIAKKDIKRKEQKQAREKRKEIRQRKEALKTTQELMSELQAVFNKYIRLRDIDQGCISCDKPANWHGQWHASHYYPSKNTALRFNLWNVHKSCSVCNSHLSGNLRDYKPRLIEKIGTERYEHLVKHSADITRFDREWLLRAKKVAAKAVRRLEKRLST